MVAELARCLLEDHSAGLHRHGRQRVRFGAWRIEWAHTCLARDAEVPLSLGVVGLKVGVGDRPVGKAGPGNRAFLAGFDEVNLVKAPEVGSEVHSAAADHASVDECRLLLGFVVRRLPEGRRLFLRIVRQQRLCRDAVLVMGELLAIEPGPLLKSDHAESVARKFAREHAARRAQPMMRKSTWSVSLYLRCGEAALMPSPSALS